MLRLQAAGPRKGYLKNRNQNGNIRQANKAAVAVANEVDTEFPALAAVTVGSVVNGCAPPSQNKFEIMGKLWLRSEVKTLESEMSRKPVEPVTPFLVMDAAALTDSAQMVKNLIKTKKFVVLIPSAGE